MSVAVLFARRTSVYKTLEGVDVFDVVRDARSFRGGMPVVAHPPCRAWGRYAWRAKPAHGERELALLAVELARSNGGVVEHPATSVLWDEADLRGGWLLPISQRWFGHRAIKPTILAIFGVAAEGLPAIPMSLAYAERAIESMGRAEREGTPPELATWLCDVARRAA